MVDIVELILADHRRIDRQRAAMREASCAAMNGQADVLAGQWERLTGLIRAHVAAGREVCWLPMAGRGADGLARVQTLAADTGDITEAIAEARLAPLGSPAWWLATSSTLGSWQTLCQQEEELLACYLRRASRVGREQLARQRLAFLDTWQDERR